jgi:hypothetical protein
MNTTMPEIRSKIEQTDSVPTIFCCTKESRSGYRRQTFILDTWQKSGSPIRPLYSTTRTQSSRIKKRCKGFAGQGKETQNTDILDAFTRPNRTWIFIEDVHFVRNSH